MSNPYMRHINRPQTPRPLWLRVISYISAGIVLVLFGVFMMMWKYLKAKDRFGRLRDID